MSGENKNREELIVLDLLRHALWGDKFNLSLYENINTEQWLKVIDIAAKQTITGNVADAILELPEEYAPSRDIRMKLLLLLCNIEAYAEKVENVSAEVVAKYREAELDFFLLKGMASGMVYPQPKHRIQGDVDLYFPKGGCHKAQSLLFDDDSRGVSGDNRHYHEMYKGILIENHSEIGHFESPIYKGLEQELKSLLRDKEPIMIMVGAEEIASPCADFNVIFMLEHAAFHLPDAGLGLRHLCDWARQLWYHKDSINAIYINGVIEKYALGNIANAFAMVCVNDIGMPEDVLPFKLQRNKKSLRDYAFVYRLIMQGGNFGRHFDLLNSTQRHVKLNKWLRKLVSLFIFLRARRKYSLVNPELYSQTFKSKFGKLLD